WLYATRYLVLVRLPGTLLALKDFRSIYDPLPGGLPGVSYPDQISLACSRFSDLLRRNRTWKNSVSSGYCEHCVSDMFVFARGVYARMSWLVSCLIACLAVPPYLASNCRA